LDVYVTKADGSKQLFDKEKVIQTCLRMGANREAALGVARSVEEQLHQGMSTKDILRLVFALMRKQKPAVRHLFDLRYGISLMEPKPEFEMFVRILLSHNGFRVEPNRILRGLCGEHEADAIAMKDGSTYFVEIKHHISYHALTGLDESRIARAIIEDLHEGYTQGISGIKVDRAMIVTNTKYSEHAKNYGGCRGILQVGWVSPATFGLKDMVEKHKLYPLSCLRGLNRKIRLRLVESGILLIKDLLELDYRLVEKKSGLPQQTILSIVEKARHTLGTLWY
jgi:hypothetical protein